MFDQRGYRVRVEWGPNGLRQLAPVSDVVVIVDVLSFTTSVDIILGAGGTVHPYRWHDGTEAAHAESVGARLAIRSLDSHDENGNRIYSLSPETLVDFPAGESILLPSPNGSALAFAALEAGASHVLAGCIRNASAVGAAADRLAGPDGVVGIIAAGERWKGATGPMRAAWEDLVGAGAIASVIDGTRSPEARAAESVFADAAGDLVGLMTDSCSGREHVERGTPANVALAADLDTSSIVPILRDDVLVHLGAHA